MQMVNILGLLKKLSGLILKIKEHFYSFPNVRNGYVPHLILLLDTLVRWLAMFI